MEVTAEAFRRFALELSEIVPDNKRQGHSVWVILAVFSAMRCINDLQYLLDDGESSVRTEFTVASKNLAFQSAASIFIADY